MCAFRKILRVPDEASLRRIVRYRQGRKPRRNIALLWCPPPALRRTVPGMPSARDGRAATGRQGVPSHPSQASLHSYTGGCSRPFPPPSPQRRRRIHGVTARTLPPPCAILPACARPQPKPHPIERLALATASQGLEGLGVCRGVDSHDLMGYKELLDPAKRV